jgi:aspartyl-tRNA(Asn)/glutamyl-tRNA(Gln) amidotransferase subunit C
MTLNRADVEKIARLARLKLDEHEIDGYVENLSSILDLVEQMNTVDTSNIEPMAHPQDTPLRMREDVATEPDRRDEFQDMAPQTESGLYLVPKVLD